MVGQNMLVDLFLTWSIFLHGTPFRPARAETATLVNTAVTSTAAMRIKNYESWEMIKPL